jgi:transposase
MARKRRSEDPKLTALREARCLNPRPQDVTDEAFRTQEFFDARDVVQVKYEMVRRVRAEGMSVTDAAAAFGYSRPSFYEAAAALERAGLDGLVPAKPGPRAAHKLTDEICGFVDERLTADPALRIPDLITPILDGFGVRVHPRSVERALGRYRAQRSKSGD